MMNTSGRLQKDVVSTIHALADGFKLLTAPIRLTDKITGSFARTLELFIAYKFARLVMGGIGWLDRLVAGWVAVGEAATAAGAAQARALEMGAAGGAANVVGASATGTAVGAALATRRAAAQAAQAERTSALAARIGPYTRTGVQLGTEAEVAGIGGAAAVATTRVTNLKGALFGLAGKTFITTLVLQQVLTHQGFLETQAGRAARNLGARQPNPANPPSTETPGPLGFFQHPIRTFFTSPRLNEAAAKEAQRLYDAMQNQIIKALQHSRFAFRMPVLSQGRAVPGVLQGIFNEWDRKLKGIHDQGRQIFGGIRRVHQIRQKFDLTPIEQLNSAQAALTRSTADDVKAAREVVARVKNAMDRGVLHGQALLQALGLEASALSTIWSAEDTAAQKRAARVQAMVDPLRLEVQLSREQATGSSTVGTLKELRAAAQKALASGKLTMQQQKDAWDRIASLNSEIKDALKGADVTFQVPARLQLALAQDEALGRSTRQDLLKIKAAILHFIATHKKNIGALVDAYNQLSDVNQQLGQAAQSFTVPAQLAFNLARDTALGRNTRKDLLAIRKAILRFIHTHKGNLAALTDAYNQLADINQQLGATAQTALGLFKQASTRALTQGLGLTAEQRAALRARLSQLGPGGTIPGSGVGAAGYAIDPNTGRPLARHRDRGATGGAGGGGGGGRPAVVNATIDLNVYIDGKQVEATVTKRQQKRRRRNPGSRRGPNAGAVTA
jgi:hypothetical protein